MDFWQNLVSQASLAQLRQDARARLMSDYDREERKAIAAAIRDEVMGRWAYRVRPHKQEILMTCQPLGMLIYTLANAPNYDLLKDPVIPRDRQIVQSLRAFHTNQLMCGWEVIDQAKKEPDSRVRELAEVVETTIERTLRSRGVNLLDM